VGWAMRRPYLWIGVGLPAVAAVAFFAGWCSGVRTWGRSEAPAAIHEANAELDHQLVILRGRMANKQWVTDQVIDGRMRLGEAIDWFRRIDGDPEADDSAIGRSVIAWVKCSLPEAPERAEELTTRLSKELECSIAGGPRVSAAVRPT
jgi:hypothetical protein